MRVRSYNRGMRSDTQLLEAWRAGEHAAGEELFERYFDSIARFFQNKLSEDVGDLVQKTFAACVEGRDRIRAATSFRSYLFAIAHNQLRGALKQRYRGRQHLDLEEQSIHDLAPGPGTLVGDRQEHRLLLEALRHIPIEHQVILEML